MSNVRLIVGHIDNAEHCVCCGSVIPEGRQVCIICGLKTNYKQSTADVVEVVRCKDCVFSREMDKYEKKLYLENCVGCTKHSVSYHSVIMQGDDFCSYGERKDGE